MFTRPRARFGALIATLLIAAGAVFGGASAAEALPPSYTVTFDAQGGSVLPTSESATFVTGYKLVFVPTASKDNAAFLGWYDQAGTAGSQVDLTQKITGDETVYAHYTALTPLALAATADAGQVGVAYSDQLGTGADASFVKTIGSLPTGLTLSSAGLLSGTPTVDGTYVFRVRGTSSHAPTITQDYSVTVAPGVFTTVVPTISGVATPGSTLTAVPGIWSPVPLPDYTDQWLLDGSPILGATASTYVVRTTDTGHTLSVRVGGALAHYTPATSTSLGTLVGYAPAIPTTLQHDGQALSAYSFDVAAQATGGAATSISQVSGALPDGLSLSSAGVISGIPQVAGSFTVGVKLSNTWGSASTTVSITIAPLDGSPTIRGNPAAGETITAVPGTWVPAAPGGVYGYQWYRGTTPIPAGQGGTSASYQVRPGDEALLLSVKVTDPADGHSATSPGVVAGIAPKLPKKAEVDGQASIALAASAAVTKGTNPKYAVTGGALPPGVELIKKNGDLTGTPTQAGTFVADITATNTWGSDTVEVTFVIEPGPLAHLNLKPNAVSTVAGGDQTFTVVGRDVYGEKTAFTAPAFTSDDASATIGTPLAGPVGTYTVTATFTAAGPHHLTATSGAFSDTSTVAVAAGPTSWAIVTPSALTVDQGGSLTFTVAGTDAYGNPTGDLTSQATFTSDWSVDQIAGNVVTFPHASPHVITATVGAVQGSVTVQVIPAPVVPAAASPAATLASTGVDAATPALFGGIALLIGVAAVGFGALRRRLRR